MLQSGRLWPYSRLVSLEKKNALAYLAYSEVIVKKFFEYHSRFRKALLKKRELGLAAESTNIRKGVQASSQTQQTAQTQPDSRLGAIPKLKRSSYLNKLCFSSSPLLQHSKLGCFSWQIFTGLYYKTF